MVKRKKEKLAIRNEELAILNILLLPKKTLIQN
jgi:hypothetical protein